MEFLQNWIMRITLVALLVSIAAGLMPEGTPKRLGRFLCGLVMMIGIITPLYELADEGLFVEAFSISETEAAAWEDIEQAQLRFQKKVIETELAAYVWDKAQDESITVEVYCEVSPEGVYTPHTLTVWGADPETQQMLQEMVTAELGIPAAQQRYEKEEVS